MNQALLCSNSEKTDIRWIKIEVIFLHDVVTAFCHCRLVSVWSVSEKLNLCPGTQPLMFPTLFVFLWSSSHSTHRFQFVFSWSSQAGLCVHRDGRERSAHTEEPLTLRPSLNQRFLSLWLYGIRVCLADLLQQEHISISPLSVFTSAQRLFTQDLLYGLQIRLLRLK